MFDLPIKDALTLAIAAYAAVVSTFVFGWDAYKWLNQGAKVRVSGNTGMKVIGGGLVDPKTYVSVTAVNHGDRATTITNLGMLYYDSWFRAYLWRSRPSQSFIISTPSQAQVIPYTFEVGAQWLGMAEQTKEADRMIAEGYLFVVLYCSTVGRGIRRRLTQKEHSAVKNTES